LATCTLAVFGLGLRWYGAEGDGLRHAVTLAFMTLFDRGGLLQLALSALAALATAGIGTLAARFAARTGVTGEGWIPAAMLPVYGFGVAGMVPMLAGTMGEEIGRLQGILELPWEDALLRVAVLVVPLLAAALILREVARGLGWLPKILRDLRALARLAYQPTA